MTEKVSASKRLEEKFDIIIVELYSIKGDIATIQKQMEMQPKIDQQSFDSLKETNKNSQLTNNVRFNAVESRTHKLEENQTWIARTVIGQVVLLLFGVIATFYLFTKGL